MAVRVRRARAGPRTYRVPRVCGSELGTTPGKHRPALHDAPNRGQGSYLTHWLFGLFLEIDGMEAGGIEPPSVVAPSRASTSVVCGLISPGGRFADDLPTGQPILWSRPSGDQRSFGASPFSDAAIPNHGPNPERRVT